MRRFSAGLLLVALLAVPQSSRAALEVGRQVATITTHGLQLTLTIPKSAYPRYALVRVHAVVKNVSGQTIWIAGNQYGYPGISNPEPQVLGITGTVTYPPAFKYLYPLPVPYMPPQPLAAGTSLAGDYLVILRGARVRLAVQYTTTNPTTGIGPFATVHTGAIHLSIGPARRPTMTTDLTPGHFSAVVQRPQGAQGSLLRVQYAYCPGTTDNWKRIVWSPGGTTLAPDCSPAQQWHVIAGWIGYSVVRVDYSAPGQH